MKFELSKEFILKIQKHIDAEEKNLLLKELSDIHAADIAEIYELLSLEQAYFLHVVLEDDKGADILMELEDSLREQLLEKLSPKEIAEEVLENLDLDDAADIVLDLPKDVKERGTVLHRKCRTC